VAAAAPNASSCALTAVSDHSGLSANRAGAQCSELRLIIVWLEVRVLPAPPRSLTQTEISRFSANSPELAGILARVLSPQSVDWISFQGPFRGLCLCRAKSRFPRQRFVLVETRFECCDCNRGKFKLGCCLHLLPVLIGKRDISQIWVFVICPWLSTNHRSVVNESPLKRAASQSDVSIETEGPKMADGTPPPTECLDS
jgi:hypothetical protein